MSDQSNKLNHEQNTKSKSHQTAMNNLPPGCLRTDIDGPEMPRCFRCLEEVNAVNDVGICEDCEVEEENE